ncbi:MAG: phospho-sugar mutase [Clostridia bacterium]|nr:phospho-sugar mutase [Clostridia bacterium]
MTYQQAYEAWLASPVVDEQTKEELHALANNEEQKEYRFIKMLDFGTAGLRGLLGAGLNMMNIYTVRYTTQGLADLINGSGGQDRGVCIAYDSRNMSPEFAAEVAGVLAANGIKSFLFDELRPVPELSFALRELGCIAGINITASHNPKEYNGYKVYWEDGAQLPPNHAAQISARLKEIDIFEDVKVCSLEQAKADGWVTMLSTEMDDKYLAKVLEQSIGSEVVAQNADQFKIIYTPFHGAGYRLVPEVLKRMGMKHVLTVPSQMEINGNFPTVKSPNPEDKEGFTEAIRMAQEQNIDLIIGTDPDADRCGIVVRRLDGQYVTLSGNQVGVLLLDYLIRRRRELGTLADNSAVIKSIVTTNMAKAVCEKQGVTLMDVLTGFKFIGEKIKEFEQTGEYTYLFGFEESYGYLAGTYARDKDAIVASMLVCEMACWYRTQGKSLYEGMQDLYEAYGWFGEQVVSITMPGLDGLEKIKAVGVKLRKESIAELAGLKVSRVRDYLSGTITDMADGKSEPTGLPTSDVMYYELEEGSSLIVRPSGTEPKIKLYIMASAETQEACEQKKQMLVDAGKQLIGV